jgi:predicted small secreted protein
MILFYTEIIIILGIKMSHHRFLSVVVISLLGLSGCNTIGGFGQDLSQTGKAVGDAASWSQNQIQDMSGENTSSDSTNYNSGASDIVVQNPPLNDY